MEIMAAILFLNQKSQTLFIAVFTGENNVNLRLNKKL